MILKQKRWVSGEFKFKQYKKPDTLQDFFPYATPLAIDLLSKLMNMDPKKRITAKEALDHPFFAKK